MALNAYVNDFTNKRTLNEKCAVCNRLLKDEYFTVPAHDNTRAFIKENRMCSKQCMNHIAMGINAVNRREYGNPKNKHSDSNM